MMLLLFVWNTLTVVFTVLTTIALRPNPLVDDDANVMLQ